MARPERPQFIIVGVPGLPCGTYRTTCGKCGTKYPLQASTAMTITQLGKDAPPVVCYGCAVTAGLFADPDMMGIRDARARYGLDN